MREVQALVEKIDLSASHMKPFEGFIFLCGGPTDITSEHPVSIRDAIQRELVKDRGLSRRIRLAEDFKDWSHESLYRDLISFETHLAELSSVIVLVLESAGSIAELGLFSAIEEFRRKLLVFVETGHYQADSFIRLGPINFLEKAHENIAHCHRWLERYGPARFDREKATELQSELAEAVRLRLERAAPMRPLDIGKWLDGALLAVDLLGLCSALTVRELRSLMSRLGCEKSDSETRQLLFLLERVGLLAMEPKGDQRFYVGIQDQDFIRFAYREGHFDAMRFRSDALARYALEDKKRFRAIHDARGRNGK